MRLHLDLLVARYAKKVKDLPPLGYYVIVVLWIGLVISLGFVANVRVAAAVLAGSLVVFAVVRVFDKRGLVPHVRKTSIDVATLLIFAVVLGLFSTWGNNPAIS